MNRRSVQCFCVLASIVVLFTTGCNKKTESSSTGDNSSNPSSQDASARRPRWSGDEQFVALRMIDMNNLKMLGIAMHNYASAYRDNFPPAAICDQNGKPLLSWRVAILPFIEQQSLYQMFRLNEPWDSEHNKKLIPMMPKTYLLPGSGDEKEGYTNYCVLVAPANAPSPRPIFTAPPGMPNAGLQNRFRISTILDGTSNTILIAESETAVIWTRPDDLVYDNKKPLPKLGYFWKDKTNVLWADASAFSISRKVSEKTLRDAMTADDGSPLGGDLYDN